MRLAISVVAILLAWGCSQSRTSNWDNYEPRENTRELSERQAFFRQSRVSEVSYELSFEFKEDSDEFHGVTTVRFQTNSVANPLTIDFRDGEILEVLKLGQPFQGWAYNKNFLTIPAANLEAGLNEITIKFKKKFSDTGSGLYRTIDKADGKAYIYTDFEPYDANMMFPCFDQPDLRADYLLKVTAPASWQVITSTMETSVDVLKDRRKLWTFPVSKNFATYIFPLHAGPYHMWKDTAGDIPLRLFARQSVRKYVRVKDWMDFTKQGFGFFNKYFDYKYPFVKYDQVIVPDFNSGAMENVAAVTFSEERFVRRGDKTREERRRHAEVVLHEMAHMWFGNLVSPKWWNGLWLNESFATYMAFVAMAEATEFKEAWENFFTSDKRWAYWEDQLVTTHPIELPVASTGQAFANFDGITYGKGAAALKQLSFYVGKDQFRAGVQNYFKAYAFKNATLQDFLGAIAEASGKDLKTWSDQWLQTAGLNTLTPKFQCENGKVTSMDLVQGHSETGDQKFRPHRTRVALYVQKGKKLAVDQVFDVSYSEDVTALPQAVGRTCPVLVHTNYGDEDFQKQILDDVSLATLTGMNKNQKVAAKMNEIESSFVRVMLWSSLEEMVADGRFSAADYIALALESLGGETNADILLRVTRSLRRAERYLPRKTLGEQEARLKIVAQLEEFIWNKLVLAKGGSELQTAWYEAYKHVAETEKGLGQLAKLLSGKVKLRKFAMDQDRRWEVILRLNQFDFDGSEKMIAKEQRRDKSTRGAKEAIRAQAVRPEMKVKSTWYEEAVKLKERKSVAELNAAMSSLFPSNQEDLHQQFADRFYVDVLKLKDQEPQFLRRFTRYVTPTLCDAESAERAQKFASTHKENLPAVVVKGLRVSSQESRRCVKAQALLRSKGFGAAEKSKLR